MTRTTLIQIRYSSANRFVLNTDPEQLYSLVWLLLHIEGARILCFAVAADHVHVLIEAVLPASHAIKAITQTLTRRGGLRLAPTWCEPIRDKRHLRTTVEYQIRQPSHHGLGVHDALWPGTAFPDLVGARRVGTFRAGRLLEHLPDLHVRDLLGSARLPALQPLGPDDLARLGPAAILDAAARTVARPHLHGREGAVREARRAAVHLIVDAGLPAAAVLRLIPVGRDTLRRDLASPPNPQRVAAILRMLEIQGAVERDRFPGRPARSGLQRAARG